MDRSRLISRREIERELLKRLAEGDNRGDFFISLELLKEVEAILVQPEPFKPDWDNYRQGAEDAKREPIDTRRIALKMFSEGEDVGYRNGYVDGIKYAEKAHGIGVDDVASPTLARLIEEVKNDSKTRHVYNRAHNRHNR